MKITRLSLKIALLFLTIPTFLSACSSWQSNQGIITLDLQDKTQTYVTGQDLPAYYKLSNSEQELKKFEINCREEIKASQLDGSEEMVFENIKHGIHGFVEFKKCSDRITRIYRY
ncbi:hypothetical protein [Gilliamella sp. wkB178]|uniref:hypothetical protein n=1 Tax=Gilliamella sp. wkB178 TaxID=3120259 RepID=UPI00114747D0|nr:hypothetical protein [Gilliamella apicola]